MRHMKAGERGTPPQAAFMPIGVALLVIGMTTNAGLIGAGAVFFVIGVAAVARHRKRQREDEVQERDENSTANR